MEPLVPCDGPRAAFATASTEGQIEDATAAATGAVKSFAVLKQGDWKGLELRRG